MEAYDDDVVLRAAESVGPTPGLFVGKEAVGRWFADWIGTFDDVVFEILEMEQGSDALAAHARLTARGPSSGLEVGGDIYYAYWFREGKIVRVEVADSRESAWRAAGVTG
jgi:hypothetical protein